MLQMVCDREGWSHVVRLDSARRSNDADISLSVIYVKSGENVFSQKGAWQSMDLSDLSQEKHR